MAGVIDGTKSRKKAAHILTAAQVCTKHPPGLKTQRLQNLQNKADITPQKSPHAIFVTQKFRHAKPCHLAVSKVISSHSFPYAKDRKVVSAK